MILEAALIQVKPGMREIYEATFREASPIIASAAGYIRHELHRCVETDGRYLLLVWWETIEDHTVSFRGSPAYQEWKRLLHPLYEPGALVEHYTPVLL
ncbi:antibiotic biosynthesis monooxygenase [Kamptonema cortianum]|nr:antibiotic biosynthesis monooxygenase [Kamptonema cortianum]